MGKREERRKVERMRRAQWEEKSRKRGKEEEREGRREGRTKRGKDEERIVGFTLKAMNL